MLYGCEGFTTLSTDMYVYVYDEYDVCVHVCVFYVYVYETFFQKKR